VINALAFAPSQGPEAAGIAGPVVDATDDDTITVLEALLIGVPLMDIQEMGGWETFAMVKRYAHLLPAHLAHRATVIDGLIDTNLAQPPNS